MMHRVWTKIVVAGLVILGEGAFASKSNERCDDRYESNRNTVQLSQPADIDDTAFMWHPSLAGVNTIQPDNNLTYHTFSPGTVPFLDPLKYHPFNPRAPPVPAN